MAMWQGSDARTELIELFGENDCRMMLGDVADLMFDHDVSEEFIYAERLVRMESEEPVLQFPLVLVTGSETCEGREAAPIHAAAAHLSQARAALVAAGCAMDVEAVEGLDYAPVDGDAIADDTRRNIVSELYNRGEATFRYAQAEGAARLRLRLLTGECAGTEG